MLFNIYTNEEFTSLSESLMNDLDSREIPWQSVSVSESINNMTPLNLFKHVEVSQFNEIGLSYND